MATSSPGGRVGHKTEVPGIVSIPSVTALPRYLEMPKSRTFLVPGHQKQVGGLRSRCTIPAAWAACSAAPA